MVARSVGETLVECARKRGMVLFVDTDGIVKYYPANKMGKGFLRLINSRYHFVRDWIITDAVS